MLKSKVIYYNFGESGKDKPDKIVASDEYSDTIMADIFFMGSDRSVVVGDNSIVIYKGKAEPKKKRDIDRTGDTERISLRPIYRAYIA